MGASDEAALYVAEAEDQELARADMVEALDQLIDGGIEKGLLRAAADGLLPGDLLRRRKSIYPGAADPAYERAIDAQLRRLLTQPGAPLFELISREALTAAYAADPRLPGLMSVQPSSTSPVAFLLDVNRWLERSGVTIR